MAVVYTRNDYGDGLEIDPRTHPMMSSLTDLSPREMQEGSIQMGINILSYFLSSGRRTYAVLEGATRKFREAGGTRQTDWSKKTSTPLQLTNKPAPWSPPQGWGDQLLNTKVQKTGPKGSQKKTITLRFKNQEGKFKERYHKAVITRECSLDLTRQQTLLLSVTSRLEKGAKIAVGLRGPGIAYKESKPRFVRPGKNPNIAFRLNGKNFKSADTDWKYKTGLPAQFALSRLYIVVFPQQPQGTMRIGNLRVTAP